MRIVGLTGGIASGKSTVSNLFKAHGIPVVDADIVARDVLRKGTGGWKKVVAAFGEDILQDDGEVDRPKLGHIVFSDPGKRQLLNRLLAPYISSGIFQEILKLWMKGCKVIVLDIPLLFEVKMDRWTKPIIVVWVDPETQLERLMGRDGTTKEEAGNRIQAQMPLDVKRSKADIVVDNTGSLTELNEQFQKMRASLVASVLEEPSCLLMSFFLESWKTKSLKLDWLHFTSHFRLAAAMELVIDSGKLCSSGSSKRLTWVLKVFIHCENCKKKVKKILHRIDGVYTTVIDSDHQKVVVTGNVDGETLIKKLAKSGKLAEILPESFDNKVKKSSKLKKETGGEEANPGQVRKKPKEKTEKVAPSGGKPEEKGGGGGSGESEAAGAQPSTGGGNGGAKKMKKRKGRNKGTDMAGDQTGGTGTADYGATTPVFQNINQLPPTTYYYPIPAYEMSYYNTTYPSTSSDFSHYYDQPLESRIDHRSTHDPIHANDYGYEDDDDSGCYIM